MGIIHYLYSIETMIKEILCIGRRRLKHDYCNAFSWFFAVITILGMPIALALVGGGMAAIVAGDLMPLFTSVQKMFSSVDSFTLAAIPFLCWLAH